jgi:hypothetical protein
MTLFIGRVPVSVAFDLLSRRSLVSPPIAQLLVHD